MQRFRPQFFRLVEPCIACGTERQKPAAVIIDKSFSFCAHRSVDTFRIFCTFKRTCDLFISYPDNIVPHTFFYRHKSHFINVFARLVRSCFYFISAAPENSGIRYHRPIHSAFFETDLINSVFSFLHHLLYLPYICAESPVTSLDPFIFCDPYISGQSDIL